MAASTSPRSRLWLGPCAIALACDAPAEAATMPTVPLPAPAAVRPRFTSEPPAEADSGAGDEAPPYELHPLDVEAATHPLEDPSGQALSHFYAALARIDRRSVDADAALVRVSHWGDSSIGRDGFPDALRSHFWQRFGDGGPGFIMPESFTGFYQPKSVRLEGNEEWSHCYIAYRCRPDGNYGFGGVTFSSTGGALTTFQTIRQRAARKWGRSWARAELWYAAVPHGGQLSVRIDGRRPIRLKTANEVWEDRWWSTRLEPGPHEIDLRARGYGRSRVYGMVLESEGPGVVWDAIPMSGAFTKRLREWDDEHIRQQVAHRKPDLIVFQYGGNDLKRIATGTDPREFREELDDVLPKLLEGHPKASCLVVGITAHGRSGHFEVQYDQVRTIANVQREAALAHGCAFFDSLAAMGDEEALVQWRRRDLIWDDLAHLSPRGRVQMAQILWEAIISDYVEFRRGEPR